MRASVSYRIDGGSSGNIDVPGLKGDDKGTEAIAAAAEKLAEWVANGVQAVIYPESAAVTFQVSWHPEKPRR